MGTHPHSGSGTDVTSSAGARVGLVPVDGEQTAKVGRRGLRV